MAGLRREKIVQTALRVLDRVGYSGLTTRAVAKELGVQQPALYWHFKSKRELADAMAHSMLAPDNWPGPHDSELAPDEWLAQRAHAFRQALLSHRDGALMHAGTTPEPKSYPQLVSQIECLVEHGLRPDDALRLAVAVSRYTVGWVLEEQALQDRDQHGIGDPSTGEQQTSGAIQILDSTAAFDFGLRCMIAGAMEHRNESPSSSVRRMKRHGSPTQR